MIPEDKILSALSDKSFTQRFPAFTGLKARLDRDQIDIGRLSRKRHCCGRTRTVHGTIVPTFMAIVANLPDADLAEFKKYVGVDDIVVTANSNGVARLKRI